LRRGCVGDFANHDLHSAVGSKPLPAIGFQPVLRGPQQVSNPLRGGLGAAACRPACGCLGRCSRFSLQQCSHVIPFICGGAKVDLDRLCRSAPEETGFFLYLLLCRQQGAAQKRPIRLLGRILHQNPSFAGVEPVEMEAEPVRSLRQRCVGNAGGGPGVQQALEGGSAIQLALADGARQEIDRDRLVVQCKGYLPVGEEGAILRSRLQISSQHFFANEGNGGLFIALVQLLQHFAQDKGAAFLLQRVLVDDIDRQLGEAVGEQESLGPILL